MADEIFTVIQAAQYLQVCDKTVRRLIKSNKLIASKVGDRSWRIRKSDIDDYLKTHTNGTKGVAVNE
ncbi:MAG: helix-turn-helix domain-containing protein [Clostridia bacterium]|nr:helix-turn-helix domain-containing protein [Clostridia bacterium]